MKTNNGHIIFITGASGYVGAMLIDILSKSESVELIIGLDKEPIPDFIKDVKKLKYILGNTSDHSWQKIVALEKPSIIIHTAWQIREMYGEKEMQKKWNIEGSDNVFDFAFSNLFVKKLIHFSTVASYSAYSTNTIEHRFVEKEPFRKSDYRYAEEKRIVEEHLISKYDLACQKGIKTQVVIIRPVAITGPRGRYMRKRFGLQSVLSGDLTGSPIYKILSVLTAFTPITKKWCRQFVHEDDIANVISLLTFEQLKNNFDIFNICPPGPVVLGKDMAHAVNKKAILIPSMLVCVVFFILWHLTLGKIPTSKGGWKSYSYPIVVDGSKITNMYGYTYKWQPKEAFIQREGRYSVFI